MFFDKRKKELQVSQEENKELKKKIAFTENELKNLANTNIELNSTIKKLIDESNAKMDSCAIGEWCNDCKYLAIVKTIPPYAGVLGEYYYLPEENYIKYCKKRLYDNCPEFEQKEERYYY